MTVTIPDELLRRLDRPGPRYTSYPTVPVWSTEFGEQDYRQALRDLAGDADAELSLYLHLPYCLKRCHYCGCNAEIEADPAVRARYLDDLARELATVTSLAGGRRRVVQMHWGGGTPNFLGDDDLRRLMGRLQEAFAIDPAGEISIEVDPRLGTPAQARLLRELGFNRVSLGVQDFRREVQVAIGRVQPEKLTRRFYEACREAGFASVNLDLVYGLPAQTAASFGETLAKVLALAPDRIACFGYAHVPWVRPNQERIDAALLPAPADRFALFRQAVETLTDRGYDWIGLDHFARRDDELAVAARERRLHRNFMGYTTRPAAHLVALGASGISEVSGRFAQNDASLAGYAAAVRDGRLPIVRGLRLSADDELRRLAILHLMCNLELPFDLTVARFGAPVTELLGEEVRRLRAHAPDGLIVEEPGRLRVTELGRYFIRNLCMELDAYLERGEDSPRFSRTV